MTHKLILKVKTFQLSNAKRFGTVEEKPYGICWCLQATAFVADHLPELTIFTNTLLFARDSIVGLQLKALSNKTKLVLKDSF